MYPTTGYTPELSDAQKRANLRRTLELYVQMQPENDYWSSQLDALNKREEDEREQQAAEILRIAEWTDSDTYREPETVGEAVEVAYGLAAGTQVRLDAARAALLREWDEEASDLGTHTIISGGEVMEL